MHIIQKNIVVDINLLFGSNVISVVLSSIHRMYLGSINPWELEEKREEACAKLAHTTLSK